MHDVQSGCGFAGSVVPIIAAFLALPRQSHFTLRDKMLTSPCLRVLQGSPGSAPVTLTSCLHQISECLLLLHLVMGCPLSGVAGQDQLQMSPLVAPLWTAAAKSEDQPSTTVRLGEYSGSELTESSSAHLAGSRAHRSACCDGALPPGVPYILGLLRPCCDV